MCNRITEEERNALFNQFWKIWICDVKKMFVCSCVKILSQKQKTTAVLSRAAVTFTEIRWFAEQ